MAILGTFTKQPAEVLDYDISFDEFLPVGDTISSISATSDVGLTLVANAAIDGARGVKQWISGGTHGVTYRVQVQITSGDGRVKEAEFKIKVKEY